MSAPAIPGYLPLFALVAPVLLIFALGAVARRARWLAPEAEAGVLKLLMNVFYPALILRAVLGNSALREPGNLLWPPLVGSLFGVESTGILLVHNIGCELAVWSVGILLLANVPAKEAWWRLLNPPLATLVAAVALNIAGWIPPGFLMTAIEAVAVCAVPIGLICSGASVEAYLHRPRELVAPRVVLGACALRLGALPVLFLLLARHAPFTPELKQVILVQAAMPAAMIPLVIARHHGGRPLVAAQVILGTTALGVFLIPAFLRLGLAWVAP